MPRRKHVPENYPLTFALHQNHAQIAHQYANDRELAGLLAQCEAQTDMRLSPQIEAMWAKMRAPKDNHPELERKYAAHGISFARTLKAHNSRARLEGWAKQVVTLRELVDNAGGLVDDRLDPHVKYVQGLYAAKRARIAAEIGCPLRGAGERAPPSTRSALWLTAATGPEGDSAAARRARGGGEGVARRPGGSGGIGRDRGRAWQPPPPPRRRRRRPPAAAVAGSSGGQRRARKPGGRAARAEEEEEEEEEKWAAWGEDLSAGPLASGGCFGPPPPSPLEQQRRQQLGATRRFRSSNSSSSNNSSSSSSSSHRRAGGSRTGISRASTGRGGNSVSFSQLEATVVSPARPRTSQRQHGRSGSRTPGGGGTGSASRSRNGVGSFALGSSTSGAQPQQTVNAVCVGNLCMC